MRLSSLACSVLVASSAVVAAPPARAADQPLVERGVERRALERNAERNVDRAITLDLQQADIVNVIRLIGDVSGMNIVVADDVKGKVTLKLKNVGWRSALNIVLKSNGAGVVEEGNILWVAPQARIDAMEQAELDRAAERELKGPLYTRIISVNNAKASDLATLVKPLLSPRGSVSFDERSNLLIIRDIAGSSALHASP